jgi:hypothetical protein
MIDMAIIDMHDHDFGFQDRRWKVSDRHHSANQAKTRWGLIARIGL